MTRREQREVEQLLASVAFRSRHRRFWHRAGWALFIGTALSLGGWMVLQLLRA